MLPHQSRPKRGHTDATSVRKPPVLAQKHVFSSSESANELFPFIYRYMWIQFRILSLCKSTNKNLELPKFASDQAYIDSMKTTVAELKHKLAKKLLEILRYSNINIKSVICLIELKFVQEQFKIGYDEIFINFYMMIMPYREDFHKSPYSLSFFNVVRKSSLKIERKMIKEPRGQVGEENAVSLIASLESPSLISPNSTFMCFLKLLEKQNELNSCCPKACDLQFMKTISTLGKVNPASELQTLGDVAVAHKKRVRFLTNLQTVSNIEYTKKIKATGEIPEEDLEVCMETVSFGKYRIVYARNLKMEPLRRFPSCTCGCRTNKFISYYSAYTPIFYTVEPKGNNNKSKSNLI